MSNYSVQIAWSGKDSLSDSDPNKIISGDDFNTEFSAIQTAVNTKAEINGNSGEDFSVNDLTASGNVVGTTSLKWGSGGTNTVGTNATGEKTISTSTPSGGSDGDVWYQVSS